MNLQFWVIEVAMPIILIVAGSLMGYIVWLLQEQRKEARETSKATQEELDAIKQGVKLVLRRDLISEHAKYVVEKQPMPPLIYDNLCEEYEAYKALGGNGMAKKLMEDLGKARVGGNH